MHFSLAKNIEEHGTSYELMKTIKRAIDPNNLFNPGKIIQF